MPLVAGARAPPAQLVGVGLPELGAPPPDRLLTHRDTAYQHQLLDLTEAEREPEGQPHAVVDDLDRVAVALVPTAGAVLAGLFLNSRLPRLSDHAERRRLINS